MRASWIHACIAGVQLAGAASEVTLEETEIISCEAGLEVGSGCVASVRRCHIGKNSRWGIVIKRGGAGVFEGNDLRGNTKGPWDIDSASLSAVQRIGNL